MNKILSILCAILILFSSCDKDAHPKPESDKGIAQIDLRWQDQFNTVDEIKTIDLWIYDAEGELVVERLYLSAQEFARQQHELPIGQSHVVIGLNLAQSISAEYLATPQDLIFQLARQSLLNVATYYADKQAEVVHGKRNIFYVALHDKPQDDSFIEGDGNINDWENNGSEEDGEVPNPQ